MMIPSYDQLICKLYESVLSDEFGQDILKELCLLTHSRQNVLLFMDRRSGHTLALDSYSVEDEQLADYGAYYEQDDPGKPFVDHIALGCWYFDHRALGLLTMHQHPFYMDFLHKHGSHSIMWTPLLNQEAVHAALAFQAGRDRPAYSSEDARILDPLLPHLINAVGLRWRFRELSKLAMLGQHLLNRLHNPVLIIDARARILFANTAGQDWMGRQKPSCSAVWLMDLASQLCGTPPAPIATIKIFLADQEEPTWLLGLPLSESHPLVQGWAHPVGIVVVHDPATGHMPWTQMLQRLFGLTRAECRLVEQLAHSHSLVDAAQALRISIATGRTHLKSIFQKTGTSNQSALLQMVTELSQIH